MSPPTEPTDGAATVIGATEPGTAIATINEWDGRAAAVRTSIACESNSEIALYINALAGSDAQLQESCGTELIVTDWLLHIREAVNEQTGEVQPRLRLVLLTEGGKRIAGGSKPVIEAWASVVRLFGNRKPWPKLGVTLQRVKSPNNPGSYVQIANVRVLPDGKGKTK